MYKFFVFFLLAGFSLTMFGCGGDSETSNTSDSSTLTRLDARDGNDDRVEPNKDGLPKQPNADAVADSEGSSTKGSSAGQMHNGFFPNMPNPVAVAPGFGGGLFPDFVPKPVEAGSGDSAFATNTGTSAPSDSDPFDLGVDSGSEAGTTTTSEVSTKPVSFLLEAKEKFESHMESEAINIVYANHLVSAESKENYQLNWYPGLKEPRLLFRFGVGIVYNSPREFDGRHPVIGDPGDPNEGTSSGGRNSRGGGGLGSPGLSGGGGGSRGSRTYKNVDTSRPDGALLFYTGDFGEQLISFLDSRRKDEQGPYFGQILKDVMEVKAPAAEDDSNDDKSNAGSFNGRSASLGIAGGGRNRGGSSNQPLQRTDTSVIDRAMGNSTAERPADDFQGTIIPGVSLVGVGSKSEVMERANEAGVDALILFNVKVSQSRGSRNRRNSGPTIFSTTSMKIVEIKTGENIFSSKALKDTVVKEKNDEGEDPVKNEIERAFKTVVDKQFKADKLPSALNEENVKKRVGRLLKNEASNPLSAAVEIASYHHAKLLTDELAKTAMTRLFDSQDAAVLVSGSPNEKVEFLKDWLPDSS